MTRLISVDTDTRGFGQQSAPRITSWNITSETKTLFKLSRVSDGHKIRIKKKEAKSFIVKFMTEDEFWIWMEENSHRVRLNHPNRG